MANFDEILLLRAGMFANPLTPPNHRARRLLMQVDRMVIVVSRLLGTVCRSGGGHLVRARRSRHVRVLRILGDMSAGRWWGHFTDLLVVLEGTRWRVCLGGRAERRAAVRGARWHGTRKG